jgi:hypothetical protein
MTRTKSKKTSKATNGTRYGIKDSTSFIPKYIGDLYPTREAAESARERLPFTVQWCSEIIEING